MNMIRVVALLLAVYAGSGRAESPFAYPKEKDLGTFYAGHNCEFRVPVSNGSGRDVGFDVTAECGCTSFLDIPSSVPANGKADIHAVMTLAEIEGKHKTYLTPWLVDHGKRSELPRIEVKYEYRRLFDIFPNPVIFGRSATSENDWVLEGYAFVLNPSRLDHKHTTITLASGNRAIGSANVEWETDRTATTIPLSIRVPVSAIDPLQTRPFTLAVKSNYNGIDGMSVPVTIKDWPILSVVPPVVRYYRSRNDATTYSLSITSKEELDVDSVVSVKGVVSVKLVKSSPYKANVLIDLLQNAGQSADVADTITLNLRRPYAGQVAVPVEVF